MAQRRYDATPRSAILPVLNLRRSLSTGSPSLRNKRRMRRRSPSLTAAFRCTPNVCKSSLKRSRSSARLPDLVIPSCKPRRTGNWHHSIVSMRSTPTYSHLTANSLLQSGILTCCPPNLQVRKLLSNVSSKRRKRPLLQHDSLPQRSVVAVCSQQWAHSSQYHLYSRPKHSLHLSSTRLATQQRRHMLPLA